jgi:hypothetical protein
VVLYVASDQSIFVVFHGFSQFGPIDRTFGHGSAFDKFCIIGPFQIFG